MALKITGTTMDNTITIMITVDIVFFILLLLKFNVLTSFCLLERTKYACSIRNIINYLFNY